MNDMNLWALIIFVSLAVIVGAIAQNNSKRFHQDRSMRKSEDRFKRSWEKFTKLYGLTDAADVGKKLYFKEIRETILAVDEVRSNNDYDLAILKLQAATSKDQAEKKVLKATHPVPANFGIFPPTSDVTNAIASTLYEDTFYTVDLGNRTCTCADFKKYENHDLMSPQRICRHQYTAIKRNKLKEFDYIADMVLSSPFREQLYGQIKTPELQLILGYGIPLSWVSIWIVHPEGFSDRYSFNLQTSKWSYGDSPKGLALKVRQALKEAFKL